MLMAYIRVNVNIYIYKNKNFKKNVNKLPQSVLSGYV